MLSLNQLDEMSRMDISKINRDTLVDINTVRVDTSLALPQRVLDYLEQVKNPYCFLCGNTPVQIAFKEDGKDLGDLLRCFFVGLKTGETSVKV